MHPSRPISIDSTTEEPTSPKRSRKRSKVWDDFDEKEMIDGSKKVICKHCKAIFKPNTHGATSHLRRHATNCPRKANAEKGQKVISFEPSELENTTDIFRNKKYEIEKVREWIAKIVILEEKPFRFVESKVFTGFCKYLNPHFEKISRKSIRRECMRIFEGEKIKLKEELSKVNRISLTSDMWTSSTQNVGYMSLTSHYLDSNWRLQKKILNFRHIPPPHSGVAIADVIHRCLVEWGIDGKISTMTLDNASSNDSVIRSLKETFTATGKIYFGGKIFQVRCCAHILNLIVKDGLQLIEPTIENIRESIKYIRGSPSRLHNFNEIVKRLELSSKRGLKLDVCTRWNSTYDMLNAALELKLAFPSYAERDSSYRWLPSQEDWSKAEDIHKFLKVFYNCTKLFSGSKYPTSNLFLVEVWKIKDTLIKNAISGPYYMRDIVYAMKSKFDKYWSECNILMAIAAILDSRYKLTLIRYCFPIIYSEQRADEEIKKVRETLYELYDFYVGLATNMENMHNTSQSQTTCSSSDVAFTDFDYDVGFDAFVNSIETVQVVTSDLDVYLSEGVLRGEGQDFDVLSWWKSKDNYTRFRTLSKMAADILSIPVTTVASESAFSTGGRVISKYRSSLVPKTAEALICTEDWLRSTFDDCPSLALYGDVPEPESDGDD